MWSVESEVVSRLEVDEVWKHLGQYGRYQLLQLAVLTLALTPMAFPVLSIVFEGEEPHRTSILLK